MRYIFLFFTKNLSHNIQDTSCGFRLQLSFISTFIELLIYWLFKQIVHEVHSPDFLLIHYFGIKFCHLDTFVVDYLTSCLEVYPPMSAIERLRYGEQYDR